MKLFSKARRIFLMLTLLVTMLGCANMDATQQRVLSGSAIGTAAGVGAAALIGGPLWAGALTGAAAGAIGGVVVDQIERH